jgi:hypothetical protein
MRASPRLRACCMHIATWAQGRARTCTAYRCMYGCVFACLRIRMCVCVCARCAGPTCRYQHTATRSPLRRAAALCTRLAASLCSAVATHWACQRALCHPWCSGALCVPACLPMFARSCARSCVRAWVVRRASWASARRLGLCGAAAVWQRVLRWHGRGLCVCVCVHACACVCMHMCVCVCVHVCIVAACDALYADACCSCCSCCTALGPG